ncbi:T9SS type A sorting domain-containing protein [Algoriphagus yeomjeoni]|uniref:T9SS type A sorting domain-containing protein n=1 Tax=Algoriphagus yeomjeoni TaxID=291403 RepID=UPI003CE53E60
MYKKRLIGLVFLLVLPFFAFSQTRGSTSSVQQNLRFEEQFNGVNLDPNPNVGSGSRVEFTHRFQNGTNPNIGGTIARNILADQGIDIPGWLVDLTSGASFFCSSIQPTFQANASVDAGGYYQIHSIGTSDIGIDYPVLVHVEYPEANTFACGETVRINTSYEILEPNLQKLQVSPPFFNQELGPLIDNLSLSAAIGINAEVGFGVTVYYPCASGICSSEICSDKLYFNESADLKLSQSLPSLPSLVNICDRAFGPNATQAEILACKWSSGLPLFNLGEQALNAYNNQEGTSYSLATFPDQNTVLVTPPDLPPNGPTLPEFEATFKNSSSTELNYVALNGGRTLKVSGNKSSITNMNYDLVSLLDYAGYTTSYSLGNNLGSIDAGDISPTLNIDQNMNFEFDPKVNLTISLGQVMNYTVFKEDGTVSYSSAGNTVNLLAGQYIEAQFPQAVSTPIAVGGQSYIDGEFKSNSSQSIFESTQLRFAEIKFPGVIDLTLIDEETPREKVGEKKIIDHAFNLEGTTRLDLPNFLLDPENPIIEVTDVITKDILNIGAGQRQVVYEIGLRNGGDVLLSDVQSTFDLAQSFSNANNFTVNCISSEGLIVNPEFDGKGDKNLLAAENQIGIGESFTIEVLVIVTPEISAISESGCFETVEYDVFAKATGVSPIGTFVENNFNQCTQEITGLDIINTVDLGAAVIDELADFTIYGFEELYFSKNFETSQGSIGTSGNLIFENVSLQGAPPVTIVGDMYAGNELILRGESKVIFDYLQLRKDVKSQKKSSLLPTGAISNDSECVVTFDRPELNFPPISSKERIQLKKGESLDLEPGIYNAVDMLENTTLNLVSGVYTLDSWKISGKNAHVNFDVTNGPILIQVNKWLPHADQQYLAGTDGAQALVTIHYSGNQPIRFKNTFFQGNILAPFASVDFAENAVLEGTLYANKVQFTDGSTFKGPKYLVPLNASPECQPSNEGARTLEEEKKEKIQELDKKTEQIRVYPNPTSNLLTIDGIQPEILPAQVYIYDTNFRLVKSLVVTSTDIQFAIQDLSNGLYFIRVGNFGSLHRVIKN